MKYFTLSLICLLTSCCAISQSDDNLIMRGSIREGKYYDPSHTFCVKALDTVFKRTIEEQINPEGRMYGVSQHSELGQMIRVEFILDIKPQIELLPNGEQGLSHMFEFVLDNITPVFPGTKMISKSEVEIEGVGPAVVGIIFIPGGSTLVDMKTNKSIDCKRGYCITYSNDNLVIISTQSLLLGHVMPDEDGHLIQSAIDARKSFQDLTQPNQL